MGGCMHVEKLFHTLLLLTLVTDSAARAADVVIADFEGSDYGDWTVEGTAFGSGPALGTLPNQQAVAGFEGRGLVNSYRDGDGTTGTLTSPSFEIAADYIAMLVGGGNHPPDCGIELLVDGQSVRQATGADNEELDWVTWDVRDLRGRTAQLRIFDRATGGWGHISVDHIVQTELARPPRHAERRPFDVAEYRRSPGYFREAFRPQFHFTPEVNWMNDPNGLVYFDGEYHLFYQYNPYGIAWGHMSWGHAVSDDMVHWKHLPIALLEEDGVMIFSGSAVVDHDNTSGFGTGDAPPLVAIYTGHQPGRQNQCLAYSNDRGRTWTKYAGNPVIDLDMADFRDPKVFWHEGTQKWVMIVALAADKRLQLYGSPDLKSWELLSEFGPAGAPNKLNWECPDMFELPIEGQPGKTKWVIEVGMGGGAVAGGSGGEYFVGDFDGKEFRCDDPPQRVRWLDYGCDFYAAVSWSDIPKEDGRRILLGWMNNWPTSLTPTSPWRGAMSLPRTLALRQSGDDVTLAQRPIAELERLRGKHVQRRDISLKGELDLSAELPGSQLEIIAEFEVGDAGAVGLVVRQGHGEATEIGFHAAAGEVYVDRRTSSVVEFQEGFAGRHAGPLTPVDGRVKLHVFVDRSSVEVFAGDGETTVTDLVFPSATSVGWQVFSLGGEAKLISLDAWQLNSVWHDDEHQ
jgi:fructan beta-fructosidase